MLAVLIAELLISTGFSDQERFPYAAFIVIVGMVLVACSVARGRIDKLVLCPIGGLALALNCWVLWTKARLEWLIVDDCLWIGFTVYLLIFVLKRIFHGHGLSKQKIFGAMAVYMLIGFAFAYAFEIAIRLHPGAVFFEPARFGKSPGSSSDILYYSFTPLSTVGYGDASPAHSVTRALSVMESTIGILYVAILIARFVALHASNSSR